MTGIITLKISIGIFLCTVLTLSLWVYKKNAKFEADFESGEKVAKKFLQKKVLPWNDFVIFHLLMLWANVQRPITFFQLLFSQFFQWIQNQRQILRFLIPIWNYCGHIFWDLMHFLQTLKPNAHKTAQKYENGFCK
jgi:hypothetical protein